MRYEIKDKTKSGGNIYYTKKQKYLINVSNVFLLFVVVLCLSVITFNYYLSPATIIGYSMQPTYNADYTERNKNCDIAYYSRFAKIERQDVVVVDLSKVDNQDYEKYGIKRLIAVGGDTVEFKENKLFINGEERQENYLSDISLNRNMISKIISGVSQGKGNWSKYEFSNENFNFNYVKFVVDEDSIFYLGDNRVQSYDCSSYGPQPKQNLLAKIVFVKPYNVNLIQYLWQQFCKLF